MPIHNHGCKELRIFASHSDRYRQRAIETLTTENDKNVVAGKVIFVEIGGWPTGALLFHC